MLNIKEKVMVFLEDSYVYEETCAAIIQITCFNNINCLMVRQLRWFIVQIVLAVNFVWNFIVNINCAHENKAFDIKFRHCHNNVFGNFG